MNKQTLDQFARAAADKPGDFRLVPSYLLASVSPSVRRWVPSSRSPPTLSTSHLNQPSAACEQPRKVVLLFLWILIFKLNPFWSIQHCHGITTVLSLLLFLSPILFPAPPTPPHPSRHPKGLKGPALQSPEKDAFWSHRKLFFLAGNIHLIQSFGEANCS